MKKQIARKEYLSVQETAKLTGITVRTLHHYDAIGLLVPSINPANGYRRYDAANLAHLQQILFLKELDFPLQDIKSILDSPNFNAQEAFLKQRHLLQLKKQQLEKLINLLDTLLQGGMDMSFDAFNKNDIKKAQEQYKQEVLERWGHTEAYAESAKKSASYTEADWQTIQEEADAIYKNFAENMQLSPASPAVQGLVADWQRHISKNFYNCNNTILAELGKMYIADERFTQNIDVYAKGLASFMSKAIAIYCKKKQPETILLK